MRPVGLHEHRETMAVLNIPYNPGSIAADTTAEQTVTVPGVQVGDVVQVTKPTLTAGVGIVNARATSVAGTVAVTWVNVTGLAVDPGSEVYQVVVLRGLPVVTDFSLLV